MRGALDFLIGYIGREKEWKWQQIGGFASTENRLGLLVRRAARYYSEPEYIKLWEEKRVELPVDRFVCGIPSGFIFSVYDPSGSVFCTPDNLFSIATLSQGNAPAFSRTFLLTSPGGSGNSPDGQKGLALIRVKLPASSFLSVAETIILFAQYTSTGPRNDPADIELRVSGPASVCYPPFQRSEFLC